MDKLSNEDLLAFVKNAVDLTEKLDSELRLVKSERDELKKKLAESKTPETKVVLQKVAGEKSFWSPDAMKKLSEALVMNTELDEKKASEFCENITNDPDVLVSVVAGLLKVSSNPSQDGSTINFGKTASTPGDRLWMEAAKNPI